MSQFLRITFCSLFLLLFSVTFAEQDEPRPKVDPNADYSDELPRIPPKSAHKSLEELVVLDGFRVEIVASEPLVADPISMSFDERGILYVICMRGYSEQATEHLGQVRALEDRDGDGRYDTGTVFADRLSWPTGIFSYDGGIFVTVPPDILYLKDIDGDRVADVRETVFTGFGRSNVQGMLNSLRWGLDNRIHGVTSSSGGTISAPGQTTPPLELGRRDFAFDPRTRTIEATSGGGQHGASFDNWGRRFVCSNSRHLEMIFYEDRYARRNPHVAAPTARQLIAIDGGQADVFRISAVEPWRIVRTRLRVAGAIRGPVEGGGTAAGYFTSATGVTVYRGNAWPRKFLGQVFIGDVGSNIVHRKVLDPDGIGMKAKRVDVGREFLASKEIWFRPAQFANAPDGTLHVLDMYREVIEHPDSLVPAIKKHLDLTSGQDRGRIYRVVPKDFRQPPPKELRLSRSDAATLVQALQHTNGWHRDTAQRLLYERQDRSSVGPLEALVERAAQPVTRLHALYTLHGLDALGVRILLRALADPHPRVREHAIRLSERLANRSLELRRVLFSLVDDSDSRVRYQLAFTLGEIRDSARLDALLAIARRDSGNDWVRAAILSSLSEGAAALLTRVTEDKSFRSSKGGRLLLEEIAHLIGSQGQSDGIAELLRTIQAVSSNDRQIGTLLLRTAGEALSRSGNPIAERLSSGATSELFSSMVARAKKAALDESLPATERSAAVRTLGLAEFPGVREVLTRLLDTSQATEVQRASLTALSRFSSTEVSEIILRTWRGFSPSVRSAASQVLFATPERTVSLLDAVQAGRVRAGDLQPLRLRLLRDDPRSDIRDRARKLFPENATSRGDVIDKYDKALETRGNRSRGKKLFEEVCSSCHRLDGVGREIGPSLAAMQARGAAAIVVNVLDPNREVNPEFVNYVVVTRDGRSLTGMIVGESATSLSLQFADGHQETVLRANILKLESTGLSFMPEGLEEKIDTRSMADLLAFLLAKGTKN